MEERYSYKEIQELIERTNMAVSAEFVIDFWNKKGWKTKSGYFIKTLGAAVNVANSVYAMKNKAILVEKEYKRLKVGTKKVFNPYKEQLVSKEWLAFRKFVMSVKGSKCEICGSSKSINIHHIKYVSGKKAWEYTCEDVLVLCNDCHMKVHGIEKNKS